MNSHKEMIRTIFFNFLVISISLLTITFLFKAISFVDVKDHNLLLISYLEAGYFPFPPGYYALIYLIDLIVRFKYPFVVSSIIVLTFFLWWRFKLIYKWLNEEIEFIGWYGVWIIISFMFLAPIYIPQIDGDFWYLGKFTQTVWHNSTLICVFPFCVLLTKSTLNWIRNFHKRDLIFMLIFGVFIALIKPSFLFCYIPALPTLLFFRDKSISPQLIQATLLVISLFIMLLLEKYLIFNWDPVLDKLYTSEEKSEVVIIPFKVWLYFSKEPVFDFITSIPLLLITLVFWRKAAFQSLFFRFTLFLLLYAIVVYFLFAETGFREYHGNFYWQIPVALFLNSFSIVLLVLPDFKAFKKLKTKHYLIASIYTLQVILGLAYWGRIFIEKTLS